MIDILARIKCPDEIYVGLKITMNGIKEPIVFKVIKVLERVNDKQAIVALYNVTKSKEANSYFSLFIDNWDKVND